ncbi:DUF4286 family protein [Polaribacter aestuariivivens]|uniref:DUF4286 family protein n=1 Tax=Polaribacter aestuariivivens TaxID=2304626 RepID=A0A5S3N4U9_9FLAO|nr:DUF4286 family protein [Polaribacter aestuariivivens]TMM30348.1 DUF4286 family protein [Polaribacter aestuariivivens]
MYIYNVTINIDDNAHDEWLIWIENHISKVLDTGKFSSAKLTEVLVEEEMGGKTYSIQFTASSREDLDEYYKLNADELRAESFQKFGNKMMTFRTELKVVNEFYPTAINN